MKTLATIRRWIEITIGSALILVILSRITPHRAELLVDFIAKGWPLILCVMFILWGFYYHMTRSSK